MKRSLMVLGLLSATVLTAATSPSHAQGIGAGAPQGEAPAFQRVAADGDAAGRPPLPGAEARRDGRIAPPAPPHQPREGDRFRPQRFGLELAADLAAAETYVGITAGQLDAWRAYTTALIAFLEPSERGPGPRGPRPDAPPAGQPAPPAGQGEAAPAPLPGERLADRAVEQAEKANALKEAIGALRGALSADQLERLAKAGPSFAPGPRGHGPAGPQPQDGGARPGFEPRLPPARN